MPVKLTVVISQSQSKNPRKRQLEEEIVGRLLGQRGIEVTLVPHLYDLKPDGTGVLCLRGIQGHMVVLSWLYPRAAFWVLDRFGVRGHEGKTQLKYLGQEETDTGAEETPAEENPLQGQVPRPPLPNRWIFCLDLRAYEDPQVYVDEILRLARETTPPRPAAPAAPGGNGQGGQTTFVGLSLPGAGSAPEAEARPAQEPSSAGASVEKTNGTAVVKVDEQPTRRWYPVIDYSRCTNCLECLDFCLFGVYGVDQTESIVVQQPDNCRKGCPACSRVCPAGAIIFPQHKSPAIAGATDEAAGGGLKIDLSKLFGAPDALQVAVQERDRELLAAGREAVGMSVGLPKRSQQRAEQPRDELDDLIDAVEELDL